MSMSWTNGTIPSFSSTQCRLLDEVEELKLKLARAIKQRDGVVREFENVIAAVEEWGHVDVFNEDTKKTIRLKRADEDSK